MDSVAEHPTLLASLSDSFGEGTTLSWSHDPEGRASRTLSEELELRRTEMTQDLDTSARNDPAVVRTMELFPGATIEKVSLPKNLEVEDVR